MVSPWWTNHPCGCSSTCTTTTPSLLLCRCGDLERLKGQPWWSPCRRPSVSVGPQGRKRNRTKRASSLDLNLDARTRTNRPGSRHGRTTTPKKCHGNPPTSHHEPERTTRTVSTAAAIRCKGFKGWIWSLCRRWEDQMCQGRYVMVRDNQGHGGSQHVWCWSCPLSRSRKIHAGLPRGSGRKVAHRSLIMRRIQKGFGRIYRGEVPRISCAEDHDAKTLHPAVHGAKKCQRRIDTTAGRKEGNPVVKIHYVRSVAGGISAMARVSGPPPRKCCGYKNHITTT